MDTGVHTSDVSLHEHLMGPGDADGHGTHVAGTAAAIDNEVGVVGVAPGARVINVNVFGDDGRAHTSELLAALDRIIARKKAHPQQPMVINLSLGANVGTTTHGPLDRAVQSAIRAGITVVVAAGNERVDASEVSPAHVADAITVGAYDQANLFAAFSNYGPMVDLLAPGVEIPSLLPSDGSARTGRMTGTSAAAPHVTGAAARYLAAHPDATPQQVRDALVANGGRPGGHHQPHRVGRIAHRLQHSIGWRRQRNRAGRRALTDASEDFIADIATHKCERQSRYAGAAFRRLMPFKTPCKTRPEQLFSGPETS